MVFSIERALAQEPPFLQTAIRERLDELRQALTVYETPLRDDSLLAWKFCAQRLHPSWSFHDIVFELLLMRYLHEYTTYPEVVSHMIAATGPATVDLIQDWIIPLAKIKVLQSVGGLPAEWPWHPALTAAT